MKKYGVRFIDNDYKIIEADCYVLHLEDSPSAHYDFKNNNGIIFVTIPFNLVKYIELRKENIEE